MPNIVQSYGFQTSCRHLRYTKPNRFSIRRPNTGDHALIQWGRFKLRLTYHKYKKFGTRKEVTEGLTPRAFVRFQQIFYQTDQIKCDPLSQNCYTPTKNDSHNPNAKWLRSVEAQAEAKLFDLVDSLGRWLGRSETICEQVENCFRTTQFRFKRAHEKRHYPHKQKDKSWIPVNEIE